MENDRLDEIEKRLNVLEEALSVKSKRKKAECKICGTDVNRPWTCEKAGCPRLGVLRG